jgi:DNA topoisomerase-3
VRDDQSQDYFDFGELGGEDGKGPLLSYGPCQFPTLGFIVERHWEIEEFVQEDFWKIEVRHVVKEGSESKNAKFNWKRGQVFELQAATVLYRMCLASPEATVVEVSKALHPQRGIVGQSGFQSKSL